MKRNTVDAFPVPQSKRAKYGLLWHNQYNETDCGQISDLLTFSSGYCLSYMYNTVMLTWCLTEVGELNDFHDCKYFIWWNIFVHSALDLFSNPVLSFAF